MVVFVAFRKATCPAVAERCDFEVSVHKGAGMSLQRTRKGRCAAKAIGGQLASFRRSEAKAADLPN
jgi:hypothetical protein